MAARAMKISLPRHKPVRDAAAVAYDRVVAQARQPVFFAEYGVPDTLDGRFELICLHAFFFLYRLKTERPQAKRLGQYFFDAMFADLDRALREMGTGDLSVGKQVKRMARGFYGRIRAYQDGVESDDRALRAALERNLYGTLGESTPPSGTMARYVRVAVADLVRQPAADLLGGRVRFPRAEAVEAGFALAAARL